MRGNTAPVFASRPSGTCCSRSRRIRRSPCTSRDVALRVVERVTAIGDFTAMTAERANALATRYDIDYVVTESPIPSLREVYRNQQFHIYATRGADR